MKILHRYVLGRLIGPFTLGFVVVIVIFLLQLFVTQVIGKFVGKGLDTLIIIELLILSIPAWMTLAIPIGALAATILTFSSFSSTMELVAIQASGISIRQLTVPVFLFGVLCAIFTERVANVLLPDSNHRWKLLIYDVSRLRPTLGIRENEFSSLLSGYSTLVGQVDRNLSILKDVIIYDYSSSDRLSTIVSERADIAFTEDADFLVMNFYHGEIHTNQYLEKEKNKYRRIEFDEYRLAIKTDGFSLDRSDSGALIRGDRELSTSDLEKVAILHRKESQKAVEKMKTGTLMLLKGDTTLSTYDFKKRSSFNDQQLKKILEMAIAKAIVLEDMSYKHKNTYVDNDKMDRAYMVEYHKKYALAISALLFALLGVPLGALGKKGGIGMAAGICLVTYIFHWIGFIAGEKLADRGLISPLSAMWAANVITVIAYIFLTWRFVEWHAFVFKIKAFFNPSKERRSISSSK